MLRFKKSVFVLFIAALCVVNPAQACQLICIKTTTFYNGNLGGVTGADAKCQAEFGTGWKFPRTATLPYALGAFNGNTSNTPLNRLAAEGAYYYNSGVGLSFYAWTGPAFACSGCSSPVTTANFTKSDCSGWTSASSGVNGGAVVNGAGVYPYAPCDMALPLVCCNM